MNAINHELANFTLAGRGNVFNTRDQADDDDEDDDE